MNSRRLLLVSQEAALTLVESALLRDQETEAERNGAAHPRNSPRAVTLVCRVPAGNAFRQLHITDNL